MGLDLLEGNSRERERKQSWRKRESMAGLLALQWVFAAWIYSEQGEIGKGRVDGCCRSSREERVSGR